MNVYILGYTWGWSILICKKEARSRIRKRGGKERKKNLCEGKDEEENQDDDDDRGEGQMFIFTLHCHSITTQQWTVRELKKMKMFEPLISGKL